MERDAARPQLLGTFNVEESVLSDAEFVSQPGYERRRNRRGKSFRPRMMKV